VPGTASRARDPAAKEAGLLLRVRTWRIVAPDTGDRLDEATLLSQALGIPKIRFRAFERTLHREVAQCAQQILAEPQMARHLKDLGLRDGDTVVGLGDERTSDRRSWFEVLAALHRTSCPGSGVRFVNMASPGQTTGQMLDAMEAIRGLRPRIVLCMPGLHDARRAGRRKAPTTISLHETDRNLFEMRSAVRSAQWLWIVPPAHRSLERISEAVLPQRRYCWIGTDCNAIRSLIRAQDDHVVDPFAATARATRSASGHEDADPLLCGRRAIVRAVLQELAS
jgi:hypothetical protein